MSDETATKLVGNADAAEWTREFVTRFRISHQPGPDSSGAERFGISITTSVDDPDGLMMAWFAGAIESGKMHVEAKTRDQVANSPGVKACDPALLWLLRRAGADWGAAAVAKIAAELAGI